jgi:predicted nucleotidyltransferase component of viral defense system
MFSLNEILPFYPEPQRVFREFILREYLQYKILQIVFEMRGQAEKLCFLGGTALRIIHGNQRFSEDIDFDNTGLTEEEFYGISECIQKKLEQEATKLKSEQ